MSVEVLALLRGKARPFARGESSAIAKLPVEGPIRIRTLGLEGDEQADPRYHGGPDKAVHHYPADHYAHWGTLAVDHPLLNAPGAFGENVSTWGLTENEVCIGDRLRLGSTLLEVSQGRQPCWKLNDRFGLPDMALRVQTSLRAGWYLRVLQVGQVQAGDTVWLLARPHPEWPIDRLLRVIAERDCAPETLREILTLPLPPSWHRLFTRRLESASVEDWSSRLVGKP